MAKSKPTSADTAKPARSRKGQGSAVPAPASPGPGADLGDEPAFSIWAPGLTPTQGAPEFVRWDDWLRVFLANSFVSAAVGLLARSMMSAGWRVVSEDEADPADPADIKRVEDFFKSCHPYLSVDELFQGTAETFVLASRAYLEIVPDQTGQPAQLLELPQGTIYPTPDKRTGLFTDLDRAFVQVMPKTHGERRPPVHFAWNEILWLRGAGMRINSLNPASPIEKLAMPIDSTVQSEQYIHSFFQSGGKMGLILENEKWDQAQAVAMRRYYERMYGKSRNAHKMLILYDGTKVHDMPKQVGEWAQFLDVQSFDGRKIAGVFGVDPRLIGYPGEGNLGGNERQQILEELHLNTVNPLKKLFSQGVTRQIVRDGFGIDGVRFELIPFESALDAAAKKTLADTFAVLAGQGFLSSGKLDDVNLVRRTVDPELAPVEQAELDAFRKQAAIGQILSSAPTLLAPAVDQITGLKVPVIEVAGQPMEVEADGDVESMGEPEEQPQQRRAPRGVYERRTPFDLIKRSMETWTDRTAADLKRSVLDALSKGTAALVKAYQSPHPAQAAKGVSNIPGGGPIAATYRKLVKSYYYDAEEQVADEIRKIAKDAGFAEARCAELRAARATSLVEQGAGDIDDYLELFAQKSFDKLYADITDRHRDLYLQGLRSGWSAKELAAQIAGNTNDYVKQQIDTITRTAGTDIFNLARQRAGDESGIVAAYEYSAILDDRTTEICRKLDGVQVAEHSPDLERIRPPNHHNCRSVLTFVLVGEDWKTDKARLDSALRLIPGRFGGKA